MIYLASTLAISVYEYLPIHNIEILDQDDCFLRMIFAYYYTQPKVFHLYYLYDWLIDRLIDYLLFYVPLKNI
jgi:hypothetical protein